MLKCLKELESWANAKYGATLDRENTDPDYGGCMIYLEAPVGYVWNTNGDRTIIEAAANDVASWWSEACGVARREASHGIRVADEDERLSIEYDFGLVDGSYVPGGTIQNEPDNHEANGAT